MPQVMFSGEHHYRVDTQGRIPVPPRYRPQFEGTAVLTRGLDRCIQVFTPEAWEKEVERITRLSLSRSKNRMLWRAFIAGSFEAELDRQGRIQIPASLRQYAGIGGEVVVTGMAHFLEVWDKEQWEEQRAFLDANLAQLAESLEE